MKTKGNKFLKTVVAVFMAVIMLVISVPMLSLSKAEAVEVQIPDDAVEFNGHYYKVYDNEYTWEDAAELCESMGGHLVSITSAEEQQQIESLISSGKKKLYWIGAYRETESWAWITGEEFSYSNWESGQPDGYKVGDKIERYGQIYREKPRGDSTYKWNDAFNDNTLDGDEYRCVENMGFICEWDQEHSYYFNSEDTSISCHNCDYKVLLSDKLGFKYGRDNFSFEHKDIGSSEISYAAFQYMNPMLKLDVISLGSQIIIKGLNYINNKKKGNGYGSWGGSCYGIAAMNSSFLSDLSTSKYGAENIYRLSVKNASYVVLNNDTKLKDSINIMLASQTSFTKLISSVGNQNKKLIEVAKSLSSNSYPPILRYDKHAVNVIGILPDDFDENYYVVVIYDCNYVNVPRFIVVSKDYNEAYTAYFDPNSKDFIKLDRAIDIHQIVNSSFNNNIDWWAPGLSSSPLYNTIKKSKKSVNLAQEKEDSNIINDTDYVKFLIASDETVAINGNDGTYFTLNNSDIESNIEDIYTEELDDFGVIKVIVPYTAESYEISSDGQYYINIQHNEKTSTIYCENGGKSYYNCIGQTSVDTNESNSYYELAAFKMGILENTNAIAFAVSGDSNKTSIDFSGSNPVVQSDNDNVELAVQYDDENSTVEYVNLEKFQGSANCTCNCHKTGFMGFIWKIQCFFYRIFGMNKTCACGAKHY